MRYYTIYPVGGEHAFTVCAENEARARLLAAVWLVTTPMRADVLRPLRVLPAPTASIYECVNDEQLERLAAVLVELAVRASE